MKTRRKNGFSLLEMLVVLAILALAIGLTAPVVGKQLPKLALRAEAREIAHLLDAARLQAVNDRRAVAVTIDLDDRSLTLPGSRPIGLDAKTAITVTAASGATTADRDPRFVFFPDGTTTGGRIELRRGKTAFSIDANWLTGHVRTYASS